MTTRECVNMEQRYQPMKKVNKWNLSQFCKVSSQTFFLDEIPSKKPITVEDQIATDEHGRRRFHGAFTGGFSAGFWNTVGSLEGKLIDLFQLQFFNNLNKTFS